MRTIDLDPFWRTTIGFDRLFNLLDKGPSLEPQDNYPPFDIAKVGDDRYRIALAVAGFRPEQISITVEQNTLLITGSTDTGGDQPEFLYRGLAQRSFERRFNLADYVEVKGATLADGLLQIELQRELPEAMKPRRIELRSQQPGRKGGAVHTIEHDKVA